jgi:hypothetical protein
MKKLIYPLFLGWSAICLLLLGLTACVKDSPRTNADTSDNRFAIYLVANLTGDEVYTVQNADLEQLALEEKPWLSLSDIEYYDFSSHCIYLKKTTDIFGKGATSFAEPFVVTVNGERCYLGYFLSIASSFLPRGPYIDYPSFLAEDVIAIEKPPIEGETDVRNDSRIKEVFAKAGKLDMGLNIILNDAKIVDCTEVVTMSYSFTITNESNRTLYVPDPDKMGSSLFHYFTNGLFLTRIDNLHESVYASQKTEISLNPYNKWDINWFTRLDSQESLSRTVLLAGYPEIPGGTYRCFFRYSGPSTISKNNRIRSDGNIWIGEIDSSIIEIMVES